MVSQKPKYCKNFDRNSHWRKLSMIIVWERYCNASPKPELFVFSLFIFLLISQLIWVRLGWNFHRWFSIQKQGNWCTIDHFSLKFCTSQHSYPVPLNPGLNPNFSKSTKDITKLISVRGNTIILLSFGTLFIHIWPRMAAQQLIFVKHVKIVFLLGGVVCAAWWRFAGPFTTKQQFVHPHCIVYSYNSKLRRGQFWHALQKCLLSSHPWPNMNDQYTIWNR